MYKVMISFLTWLVQDRSKKYSLNITYFIRVRLSVCVNTFFMIV